MGCLLLFDCWLFVVCCLLLVVCCLLLLVICVVLFAVCCYLIVVRCSLSVACCSLFVMCCSLFVIPCFVIVHVLHRYCMRVAITLCYECMFIIFEFYEWCFLWFIRVVSYCICIEIVVNSSSVRFVALHTRCLYHVFALIYNCVRMLWVLHS